MDIPYEECTWRSGNYTLRLVQDTLLNTKEAENICDRCSTEKNRSSTFSPSETTVSHLKNALIFPIPTECFFAANMRKFSKKGSTRKFYYCESPESKGSKKSMKVTVDEGINKGKEKSIHPRRPCFSEDYISMISESFHYMAKCFGFTVQEQRSIFALFNHESSFILNKKSPTDARCIGQITKDTVYTMNRYVYMSNDELMRPYHNIYREALNNCPDLNAKARLPKEFSEEGNPSYSKLKKINKNLNVDCLTTQDPYSCFFYSMYNIKMNEVLLKQKLDSDHENLPQNLEISKSITDFFQLPIRLNEVLHVNGVWTTEDGKKEEVNLFFNNDYELMAALEKIQYNKEDLKVKKTPLYKFDGKTNLALNYWSYNGGFSIVRDYLKEFLTKKKAHITESESNSKCKKGPCHWKSQLEKGQSLEFDFSISEDLQTVFQNFESIDKHKWTIRRLKKKKPSGYQQLIKKEKEKIQQLEKQIEGFTTSLRQNTIGKGHPPERFTDYLWLEYNGGDRRRSEVIRFVSKVKNDGEDLSNIKTSLKRMNQNSKNKLSETEKKEFMESIKTKCQLNLLSN